MSIVLFFQISNLSWSCASSHRKNNIFDPDDSLAVAEEQGTDASVEPRPTGRCVCCRLQLDKIRVCMPQQNMKFLRICSVQLSTRRGSLPPKDASPLLALMTYQVGTIIPRSSCGVSVTRRWSPSARCWATEEGRLPHQLSRDPTNFRGLVLGCIEAKFCQ